MKLETKSQPSKQASKPPSQPASKAMGLHEQSSLAASQVASSHSLVLRTHNVTHNNNNPIWRGSIFFRGRLRCEELPLHSGELNHVLSPVSGPTQSQLSHPMSSGHHISMEHRLRRKQLNSDTNASNKTYLNEKTKGNTFFKKKKIKKAMKNMKAGSHSLLSLSTEAQKSNFRGGGGKRHCYNKNISTISLRFWRQLGRVDPHFRSGNFSTFFPFSESEKKKKQKKKKKSQKKTKGERGRRKEG